MTDKEPQKISIDEIDPPGGNSPGGNSPTPDDEKSDLSRSIKTHGLMQPILVKKIQDKKYALLEGQRRLNAFVELNKKHPGEGWDEIPAIVMDDSDGGSTTDVPPVEV